MALTAFQSCSCLRRCLISALKFLCSSVCFVQEDGRKNPFWTQKQKQSPETQCLVL
jgi:hypothetical protein